MSKQVFQAICFHDFQQNFSTDTVKKTLRALSQKHNKYFATATDNKETE